jgi:hypothetical protein
MVLRSAVALTLTALCLVGAPRERRRDAAWSELEPLVKGKRVEIAIEGAIREGKVSDVTADAITIISRESAQTRVIKREEVRRLYLIEGGGKARAAGLVALGVGAGVLGLFGALGALLDASEAALVGFAGAAGCVAGAVVLAVKTGPKRTELVIR